MQSLIKAAEEEFGESFWDIVRGFASDGYAAWTTGKILGFSHPETFKRLQIRDGVQIEWPKHGQCNVSKEPKGDYSASRNRGEYTKERADKRLLSLGLERKSIT
jgi:hypothetical protein